VLEPIKFTGEAVGLLRPNVDVIVAMLPIGLISIVISLRGIPVAQTNTAFPEEQEPCTQSSASGKET
jgi:hypothetical protein